MTAPLRSADGQEGPSPAIRTVLTKVFVTGLRLEAHIGVYDHEKGRHQPLIVDVELDVPSAGAEHLKDTVNYETIAQAARDIVAEGHIGLLEAFAERLAHACLADARVTRARVRVDKPNALAPHATGGVEVTVVRA